MYLSWNMAIFIVIDVSVLKHGVEPYACNHINICIEAEVISKIWNFYYRNYTQRFLRNMEIETYTRSIGDVDRMSEYMSGVFGLSIGCLKMSTRSIRTIVLWSLKLESSHHVRSMPFCWNFKFESIYYKIVGI